MEKLAIILDSFCGRLKSQIEKNPGMFFVPLQIEIGGELIKVGVKKSDEDKIKERIANKEPSKTSMPTPADFLDVFEKTSKEYENVIYLPLASSISGTAKMAMGLAQDFENISVIETHSVGECFINLAKLLIEMSKKGADIEKIKSELNDYVRNGMSQAYVIPMNIEPLARSGRIGKIASNILGRIKAIPLITYDWDNKKLHSGGIKRSPKKAIEFAVSKIESYVNKRPNFKFLVTATPGKIMVEVVKKILGERNHKYDLEITSPIIHSVVGDEAISISAFKIV